METFIDDDSGYLRWTADHPNGYVLNLSRNPLAYEPVVHRSTCKQITTAKRGNWTTTEFIKVCSLDKARLDGHAVAKTGHFPRHCRLCKA